ncbi:MAG TPA: hypothetical protein VFG59_02940 [Anaeromyxobacter sp.]|nr:hypothetical protein [Anaeromyxobacter sp.]
MPAHLFTLAYGSDTVRAEALYLAWSALCWRAGPELVIHICTDAPAAYASVLDRVELRHLSPEELRSWQGPHGFRFRLKPMLVQDMARRHPSEKLLFLDADTYLLGAPEDVLARIGPGRAVMHAREDHLLIPGDRHMRNFSRRLSKLSFRGAPVDVNRWMWNSGAVGLDPSSFPLVDGWIAFVDEVWPRYRRWIVEQYGLAMLLQQAGELSACDDRIFHYWYQKDEYAAAIAREVELLRARPLAEILARVRERPVRVPFRERPPRRLPFWRKWRRSLFGER